MFGVLLSGWVPVLLLRIVSYYKPVSFSVECGFGLWVQVALLLDMIDLFLYNHGVRKYLTESLSHRMTAEEHELLLCALVK